ncbi:hypothetical protein Agabi119p4_3447 [Agaricus bisporus var. burnettii]|uniref:Integrase catalytic domain-containing protein n=1 Tax=Agaricus bisporus var. burnettii TaxID=192524 RepID=A0A8H7F736_AGABI|nr:hypothetical protein Agabi119p4_3447 [Agaricus bisporus var. burnettii]
MDIARRIRLLPIVAAPSIPISVLPTLSVPHSPTSLSILFRTACTDDPIGSTPLACLLFLYLPPSFAILPVPHDSETESLTRDALHRRLGHISPIAAEKLVNDELITGIKLIKGKPDASCNSCAYAKATRQPIAKAREGERATRVGEEIHTDVWGPARVATKKGRHYYVTFTDDYSRWTHIEFLTNKSNVFDTYKRFEAWCKTQFDVRIKVLHSDRGGEYTSEEFQRYLKSRGTEIKLTVHDTPQHNGVAERRNCTIVERVRALLHASRLPKTFWAEAALHIVWLMNRSGTKAVKGKTPFEALYGRKPNLRNVCEWGDEVWAHYGGGNKLGARAKRGRWLGYDWESNGSRILFPDSGTVKIERNFRFIKGITDLDVEGEQTSVPQTSQIAPPSNPSPPNSPEVPITPKSPSVGTYTPQPESPIVQTPPGTPDIVERPLEEPLIRRSQRIRNPSRKARDILEGKAVTMAEETDWEDVHALSTEMVEMESLEPKTWQEAMRSPDSTLWKKAMEDELAMLKASRTWELVDPPSKVNIVGSKWVFKCKKDAIGNIVRYKARLVAQGYSQVPGVDYFDTFAPVAQLSSIRTVLAIATARNLEIHQIDIKGAYLNGKLNSDEVVYMCQPPHFVDPTHPTYVCHLKKTLYGLKQSGRRWYQRLCKIVIDNLGYSRCDVDHGVFFRTTQDDFVIMLVHVDDCTLVSTKYELIKELKERMNEFVEVTDLGEIHWLLGIEIMRNREEGKLHMSQRSYIDSCLWRYGFEDTKPVSIPMDPSIHYSTNQSPKSTTEIACMTRIPYQEAVGSLMYAAIATQPDIAFTIQVLLKFSKNPGEEHWEAVKRVFRYLKGTRDLWLTFGGHGDALKGYADADGNMSEDRRATSGFAFIINGGAVSWSAKRQEIVTLSTTESEYVAATHATKEALWIRSLVTQIFDTTLTTTPLFSDNKSAIALTADHKYHGRTKHIDIRFHFIRWVVEEGKVRLIYCPTEDMVADIFTKALPSPKVKHFVCELGLAAV